MAEIKIAGTLHNTEDIQDDALHSHVVATADEILDEGLGRKQSDFNEAVDEDIYAPTTGLKDRMEAVEELHQTLDDGGDIITNDPADINSTSGKIPTGAAVFSVISDTDATPTENSVKPLQSGGAKTAIDNVAFSTGEKVNELGIDDEPVAGSDNLVKSGGVYAALTKKLDTQNSSNSDFDIADDQGNVLVRITEGHVKTKNFDSRNVGKIIENAEMDDVLEGELAVYLTDVNGKAVLGVNGEPIEII